MLLSFEMKHNQWMLAARAANAVLQLKGVQPGARQELVPAPTLCFVGFWVLGTAL